MVTLRRQATHTILLSVALMSAILCPSMSFFSRKVARRVLLHPRSMADRQWQCIDVDGTSSFSFSSSTAMFATASPPIVPRAAVAVVVRWCNAPSSSSPIDKTSCAPTPRYLLVQRGNEPNKGMWSIPGGKIESGEGTLDAAKRELQEETGLTTTMQQTNEWTLKWHEDGPFTCSDSIHQPTTEGMKGFHYVISQCFAEVIAIAPSSSPPHIEARDDAMDAKWWSAEDIQHGEDQGSVSDGVLKVIERSELLYEKGLLHCD